MDSPEPPEPLEAEDTVQTDDWQPGRLHPEQDLPHVFKVSAAKDFSLHPDPDDALLSRKCQK